MPLAIPSVTCVLGLVQVIKFSGDALTIYFQALPSVVPNLSEAGQLGRMMRHLTFQAVDDTKHEKYNHVVPPHGTWGGMLSGCRHTR